MFRNESWMELSRWSTHWIRSLRVQPNDDTLLYGVEVKFYNMEVELDEHLETMYKGLYVIGDGSGVTHSLSHASASGVYVAREITKGL